MKKWMCLASLALVLSVGAAGGFAAEGDKPVAKPVNSKCPMSGKPVDAEKVAVYKGETIGFCCGNCLKKFQADPAKHISKVQRDAKK